MADTISLKQHFDALREADARGLDRVLAARNYYEELLRAAYARSDDRERETVRERFASHNDLLRKWADATEKDHASFVSIDAFNALKDSVELYQRVTDKALALAEGSRKGAGTVGVIVAAVIASIGSVVLTVVALGIFHR